MTARKSRGPTKAASPRTSSGAAKETAVARLTRQLNEAYQQQTATAEVLKVISRSSFDLQIVLNTLVKTAALLCEADLANVWRPSGSSYHLAASFGIPGKDKERQANKAYLENIEIEPGRGSTVGRVLLEKRPVQISDVQADPHYLLSKIISIGHYRTSLGVPLMREGEPIGVITLMRCTVHPFTDKQIELVSTFADQAVIAVENARLFEEVQARTRELTESLEQQTATADVLKVISRSAFDLQTVLDALLASACRLCEADIGTIRYQEGSDYRLAATFGCKPEWIEHFSGYSTKPDRSSIFGQTIISGHTVHIPDVLADRDYHRPVAQKLMGFRAALGVPLVRDGQTFGVISLLRLAVGPFSEKQIELVETFADQAVIAIENVRLITETREALERQTATAEVLQVINSSPGDLAPVFETILEKAHSLCAVVVGTLLLYDGEKFRAVAVRGFPEAFGARLRQGFVPGPNLPHRRLLEGARFAQVADWAEIDDPLARASLDAGVRTTLLIPLRREETLLGYIAASRAEVRPFTEKEIALLESFAAQAVIAMENARLLGELRERQAELARSVDELTATADVLKIISRSSVDLETVLDTLVDTVARLCRADQAHMYRQRDDKFHMLAARGLAEGAMEFLLAHPLAVDRGTLTGRVAMELRPVHIPDVLQDPEYTYEGQKYVGFRTALGIPLLREDALLGIFAVTRTRVEPFTTKEIELASTFADQAVIAIENARLFEELRERQAELRVTFDNMGDGVAMFDAATRLTAWNRNFQTILDLPDAFLAQRPRFAEYFRYLADRGEYSADLEADLNRANEDPWQELRIERTRPDGRVIEARRTPVPGGGFVLIYSDITQRKRAEEAVRRARDAAELALRELQTAQASLVHAQKMAALGQLTAGIAHEIKNPLNFVNNFAALSSELTDELSDVLKPVALPGKVRDEVEGLTGTLKDNLGRVVQHGKRADSIVKNMLLHSREGSGEHRPADINALVDESLNLAYHGARAEKPGFNITLERDFDPAVGVADIYPQEVTRVLLNLISNGFYAATKRARVTGDGFEPRLKAVTRNLGDKVEVRIRDNGTGIPPDVQEKIFNPFFTTKPAGEGTGLGLSMSHDIVVKQHGGTIEVVTERDSFTEFIITLPRVMA
jgi:PAS domain S-box-containing protein